MIRCAGCGPQLLSAFPVDRHNKRGYKYRCYLCARKEAGQYRARLHAKKTSSLAENRPIILIGDTHFPFHHEGWFAWMLEVIKEQQPSLVIQVGDLYDLFSFTRFPRGQNVMTPDEEVKEARACAEEMWKEIQSLVPDSRKVQLRGNHDVRIERRVIEHLPEVESLLMPTIEALWAFEGVETINESRQEFETRGALVHHGHRKFGAHMQYNNMSTATGHLHTGGVLFKQTLGGVIWELNVGCGINPAAQVFTYGAQKRLHGTTLGLGEIDKYGPRFIPYQERR